MARVTDDRAVDELRSLREADVDDVVSVYDSAWGEARPVDREELLSWLRNPEIEADALRVLEVDGSIVGYGDVFLEDDAVALKVTAPGNWGVFLEWAEQVARREKVNRVRVVSYRGDALASSAVTRGYQLWRSNHTMRIDFDEAPDEQPQAP